MGAGMGGGFGVCSTSLGCGGKGLDVRRAG